MSQAQVVTLFTTAKAQLTTVTTDFNTLQADLLALEQTRAALIVAGGNASAAWLQNAIKQLGQGYTPLSVPGGPGIITAVAPDPAIPRNLSLLGDVRPVSAYDPSLT